MKQHLQSLPDKFRIEDYELSGVLGSSYVGIKYLGWERNVRRRVAIKEYLPAGVGIREKDGRVMPQSSSVESNFHELLEQFLSEARALERFQHPNMVRVLRVLEANGTGYVVLDYAKGETLSAILRQSGTLGNDRLDAVLQPLLDCLEALHDAELLHQDIRPGNIVVDSDTPPVLLAFGAMTQGFSAARQTFADRSRHRHATHSPTVYSPVELYSSQAKRGPWTDIYALGATMYQCATGTAPPAAPDRIIEDTIVSPKEINGTGHRKEILAGVDAALGLRPEDRPQSVSAWREILSGAAHRRHGAGADGRLAKTSARGARLPQVREAKEPGAQDKKPRWAVPAIALTGATVFVAYLDTGLLRTPVELKADVPAITRSPIALSKVKSPSGPKSPATPVSEPVQRVDEPAPIATQNPVQGDGATLIVTTEPAQVEVLVAGKYVGRTPLTLVGQPTGNFDVTLRHRYYETVVIPEQAFEPGKESRVDRSLARAVGRLMVTTEPAGAWVERNGERLLDSTPGLLRDLPAGPIQLLIGGAGRRTVNAFAEVPKDATGYFTQALRIAYGTLTVAMEPEDATVTIPTALDAGSKYSPGMRIQQGSHIVEVSREGYRTASLPIEVDGDTRIEVALEPQPGQS